MSRHRNVRNAVYDDYDDDDYQYGHSVEDECISPTDAQQWIYDRAKGQQSMSEFRANNRDIEEEDDDELAAENEGAAHKRRDSECFEMPDLNDDDRARLLSCMDEIRDIVGETCSDRQMVQAIMKHGFECSKALDEILNSNKTPPVAKPGIKLTADTIEKDLNVSNNRSGTSALPTPTLGSARFALPKMQFSTGSNLSALAKLHKPQESKSFTNDETTDSQRPAMRKHTEKENNKPSLGTAKATTLAQFASLSIGSSSSPKFSNLSDLAKHHLESKGTPTAFSTTTSPRLAGPSLFKKPFACAVSPPTTTTSDGGTSSDSQSGQPVITQSTWIIDLKSALIKKQPENKNVDKTVEKSGVMADQIKYGFIDCDIAETVKPTIDEFCTIDVSSVLEKDLSSHRTMVSSGLGILLGIRYRKRKLPVGVAHHFPSNTTVEPFRFDVPSPDDMVLGHIKKFRQ